MSVLRWEPQFSFISLKSTIIQGYSCDVGEPSTCISSSVFLCARHTYVLLPVFLPTGSVQSDELQQKWACPAQDGRAKHSIQRFQRHIDQYGHHQVMRIRSVAHLCMASHPWFQPCTSCHFSTHQAIWPPHGHHMQNQREA